MPKTKNLSPIQGNLTLLPPPKKYHIADETLLEIVLRFICHEDHTHKDFFSSNTFNSLFKMYL